MASPAGPNWPFDYVPTPPEWQQWWTSKADYPVPVGQGGTGSTDQTEAFSNLSPIMALGDIIIGGNTGIPVRLPLGADGQILMVSGGQVAWVDLSVLFAAMQAAGLFNGFLGT